MEDEFFPKIYDAEEVFDKQIMPYLKTIINICNEHEIPMIAFFQYMKSADEVGICGHHLTFDGRNCERFEKAAALLS